MQQHNTYRYDLSSTSRLGNKNSNSKSKIVFMDDQRMSRQIRLPQDIIGKRATRNYAVNY